MGEVRLVASDLDGTLLGPDSQLSARTIAALRRARDAGIVLVAATGRSQRTALPRLAPAEVFDWAVCSNGAVLWDVANDELVQHRPVPVQGLDRFAALTRAGLPGVGLSWETLEEGFWADRRFLELLPDWHHHPPRQASLPTTHRPSPSPVTKVLVAHGELVGDELLDRVISLSGPEVTVSWSGAGFVEATAAGVDKAATLAALCERLGIGAHQVVAFGDQRNDLSLLRWAGRAVAMVDGHPMVLAETAERAGTAADDGVARYLEALLDGIG